MDYTFLTPVSAEVVQFKAVLSPQHLGAKIAIHTPYFFPEINSCKIVLVGVHETRANTYFSENNLDEVRKALYSLFPGNWNVDVADLGDITPGETIEDTYFALQQTVKSILKINCIPLIIGVIYGPNRNGDIPGK